MEPGAGTWGRGCGARFRALAVGTRVTGTGDGVRTAGDAGCGSQGSVAIAGPGAPRGWAAPKVPFPAPSGRASPTLGAAPGPGRAGHTTDTHLGLLQGAESQLVHERVPPRGRQPPRVAGPRAGGGGGSGIASPQPHGRAARGEGSGAPGRARSGSRSRALSWARGAGRGQRMRGVWSGPGARPRRRGRGGCMTWAGRGGRGAPAGWAGRTGEGRACSPRPPRARRDRPSARGRAGATRAAPGCASRSRWARVPRGAEALAESLSRWPDHRDSRGRPGPGEGEIESPARRGPPRCPLPPLRAPSRGAACGAEGVQRRGDGAGTRYPGLWVQSPRAVPKGGSPSCPNPEGRC